MELEQAIEILIKQRECDERPPHACDGICCNNCELDTMYYDRAEAIKVILENFNAATKGRYENIIERMS